MSGSVPDYEPKRQEPPPRYARVSKVVWALLTVIVLAHVGRLFLGEGNQQALLGALAVNPARFEVLIGTPFSDPLNLMAPLFGHVFLHGGWIHLIFNAILILQTGELVAARLEEAEPGGVKFLLLFFVSALGGAMTYIAFNQGSDMPAIGASGAACGLFAAYLLAVRHNWKDAIRDRQVHIAAFWFLAINVGLAFAARASGLIPIAWEAHLGGFIAGLAFYPIIAPKGRMKGPWDRWGV
jgi:membrane associated rhomboid family serine protease